MNANPIIGRQKEQAILEQCFNSSKSEFIALYGRRRVGKTYLVKNFFEKKSCVFFYCSGQKDGKLKKNIEEFSVQIGKTFYSGAPLIPRRKWLEAFEDLTKAINLVSRTQKVVLFIDEIPWLATKRSGLLQALDYYWNRYWSHDKKIKLIVCGSSASWIIKNIIDNKEGLYNRITRTICLEPFTLKESQTYLSSLGIKLNQKQVTDLYMVLGGVPHYLSLVKKGVSAYQAIDEICFQKSGALFKEFDRLFASLFEESDPYVKLIRAIAKYQYGIGQAQLILESGLPDGGRTVKKLKELEEAGFILEFIPYGHQEKGLFYKIIDEFTFFYLRWIEPNLRTIRKHEQNKGYWLSKVKSSGWLSWAGYAFESVCYSHLAQIRKSLEIEPGAEIGNWRYSSKKTEEQGAQIDLLFDRPDGVITICEIKYSAQPYVIDKNYARLLQNKINVFINQTKTSKQVFLAFVCAHGLKKNFYSEEMVTKVISLEHLFQET
jgi:AAA+ ATPase superfamily predicted ATPase